MHAYGLHLGLIKIIFGATGGLEFLVYFYLSLCIHLVNSFILEKITTSLASTVTCLYTYSSFFMAQDPLVLWSALCCPVNSIK